MAQEASRFADLIEGLPTQQIHLGGGSPTFLHSEQLVRLWEILSLRFPPTPTAEIAVEIDPRVTTADQLTTLKQLGFNRISLGVQDFDERVQKAVNRWQPFDLVAAAVEKARSLQFDSINFDLIYGLPFQTLDSMESTIEKVLSLAPDRIAFYRLAMIPEMFRWQNVFKTDRPSRRRLAARTQLAGDQSLFGSRV